MGIKMPVKKSMKSNIVLNSIKTAMGFIFPLITFPYVSRVLGTVGIGKVNFSNSIISYFALAASLGVVSYSIREGSAVREKEIERNNFFNEVFTVNFISMLISYSLLLILALVSVKLRDYFSLILIQSMVMFFSWIGVEWVFNIYEDYLQITLRAFLAQLASLVLMFVFVKTPDDYAVYALITVLASGGSYIFNYIYAGKYYRPRLTHHCNLKKHIVPMLVLAANTFAVTIYVNSDTTMIGFFLDDHHVGLYSTAVKVYNIVKHVMAAVIASATPRISFYYHNGEKDRYHNLMTKMAQVLLIVALPAMVGLFMTSEDVILVIAGNEYINSASALAILSFALLFATFGSYGATYGLIVQRKEKILLAHTTISAMLNVVLNLFMIPTFGIIGAAITTLISELYVCVVFSILTEFKYILKECVHTIITCAISCLAIVLICYFMRGISNLYIRLMASVVTSAIAHLLLILIRKEELALSFIKKKR